MPDQFIVNAFECGPFTGNPAAVVRLEGWPKDRLLGAIAEQNNLSETAFYVDGEEIALRWFTPTAEIDLCGHATLACAHVLFSELADPRERLAFKTIGGSLFVERDRDGYLMDFPGPSQEISGVRSELADRVGAALGASAGEVLACGNSCLIVLESAADVREVGIKTSAVLALPYEMIVATAPGDDDHDICSRVFAPAVGITEDPVTGAAHCILARYWSERLGSGELSAHQASKRGGRLGCRWIAETNRVLLRGSCQTFSRGEIAI